MNEVSIIINGVRYDAVEVENNDYTCRECEFPIGFCEGCTFILNDSQVFKKSDKKFEK